MAKLKGYSPSLARRCGHRLLLLFLVLASRRAVWSAPHLPDPASARPREITLPAPNAPPTAWLAAPGSAAHGPAVATGAPLELLETAVAADPLVTPSVQEQFRALAGRRLSEARATRNSLFGEHEVAREAFAFLHGRILVGRYEPTCARLHTTLADGTFNCLTATYWYLALCRDGGLQAAAIAAPNHVAVRLWIEGDVWDVETTDPRWNPRQGNAGSAAVRELSDVELLARVHYNLGIEFAQADRFELALLATRRSCQLDPAHLDARANLLATLNNWSLILADQGEYERAEGLLVEGLAIEPTSAALRRSDAYLRRQRCATSQ